MAVKDHSLDSKIVEAAKSEFLKLGYQKVSLHKIAELAGITTGALYTRYKSKDDLFCSLIRPAMETVGSHTLPFQALYKEAWESRDPDRILEVIHKEEQVYLDLLFEQYDECVLFFCRSDGSSVGEQLKNMMEAKSAQTALFLKNLSDNDLDVNGIQMIMAEQFHFYRQILEKGYSKEEAVSCMKTLETFLEAGWKKLFESAV